MSAVTHLAASPLDSAGADEATRSEAPRPEVAEAPSRWHVEDVLATLCMVVLVLVTLGNVVVRYFTEMSFAWTEEVSVTVMVLMVFAGAASAAIRNQHIRIDVFSERGSTGRRRAMASLSRGATALVFATLALLLARTAIDEIRYGELNTLDLPRWWVTVPEAVFCALVAARALGMRVRRKGQLS